MMDWLKRNDWVQESESGVSEVISFIAFLVMPGCVVGAIIHRLLQRN